MHDELIQSQRPHWKYRVQRGLGPTGPDPNIWMVTIFPHTTEFPIHDYFIPNLPDWVDKKVALLDCAGSGYSLEGVGHKINDECYWICDDYEEK